MRRVFVCLVVLGVCSAKSILYPHQHTVYHGHGATSYQNVHMQSHGSVPIPKDLQVDDGHQYYDHHIHAHDHIADIHPPLANHIIIPNDAYFFDEADDLHYVHPHYDLEYEQY